MHVNAEQEALRLTYGCTSPWAKTLGLRRCLWSEAAPQLTREPPGKQTSHKVPSPAPWPIPNTEQAAHPQGRR